MKKKRVVFRVQYRRGGPARLAGWVIRRPGAESDFRRRKTDAVSVAVDYARGVRAGGGLAQVVVHRRDGRIQFERSYGADPERSRG